jgi:molybdopterin molybdotransferase
MRANLQGVRDTTVLSRAEYRRPKSGSALIELEEALEIVRSVPPSSRLEAVGLESALGRVLVADARSPIDSPPFDKSAMDGFAMLAGDDSAEYRILDTVAAGGVPSARVARGQCARIMTGAMLPPGAQRVVRREYVQERDGAVRILQPETVDNVVRRGQNLKAGEILLGPRMLAPQDIGILAASGIESVQVAAAPRTAILCTGGEIRPAGQPLAPGQIYDSNGPQLRAQLAAMGCRSRSFGVIADEEGPLAAAIETALSFSDLLLITGGVSAGDFDFVPQSLAALGAEVLFHGIAVKPGKPALFARRGEGYVFALPGNPVSTFVIFEVLVKPFLFRRMGLDWSPPCLRAVLAKEIRRGHTERTEFLPVRVKGGSVFPIAFHGSSHLNALAEADGLVRVPKGVAVIPEGTQIDVRQI